MEGKNPGLNKNATARDTAHSAFERSDLSCRVGYATIRQIEVYTRLAKHIRRLEGLRSLINLQTYFPLCGITGP